MVAPLARSSDVLTSISKSSDIFMRFDGPNSRSHGHVLKHPKAQEKRFESQRGTNRYKGEVSLETILINFQIIIQAFSLLNSQLT